MAKAALLKQLCSWLRIALVVFLHDVLEFVCLVAAPPMPHCHSPEARHRRHERACARGCIRPRRQDETHVTVASTLAPRARVIPESLTTHAAHCAAVGADIHFAKAAAVAVRDGGHITSDALTSAQRLHRQRDRATHSWADVGALADLIWTCDPWAASHPAAFCDEGCQTEEFLSACLQPSGCASASPSAVGSLVEAQNKTIAILTGRLEALTQISPSHRRLRELESQVHVLTETVTLLRTSTSSTIYTNIKEQVVPHFVSLGEFRDRLGGVESIYQSSLKAWGESLSTALTDHIYSRLQNCAWQVDSE